MANCVVKQENGRYAIWQTITDSYIVLDAIKPEIIGHYISDVTTSAVSRALRAIDIADGTAPPLHQLYPTPDFTPEEASPEGTKKK